MKAFQWSLKDLDETDVESLFDFMNGFNAESGEAGSTVSPGGVRRVFGDEIGL